MQIVIYPAEELKWSPSPIDPNDELDDGRFDLCVDLVNQMSQWLETMRGKAYGLAATQLGIDLPVCVVFDDQDQVVKLISPKVVSSEGEETGVESCFSLPGIWGNVKSSQKVSIWALDQLGNELSIEAEGDYARRLQHEINHLNGHLFVDTMRPIERKFLLDKYKRKLKQLQRKNR